MAVPFGSRDATCEIAVSAPVALFPARLVANILTVAAGVIFRAQYAVAPDGRFLLNIAPDDTVASPITIVQSWTAGLKQ